MTAAAQSGGGRGASLLLAHCSAVERLAAPRTPAQARLAHEVGEPLARLLLTALARGRRLPAAV